MKYYYNYIFFNNVIYSCDLKLNFQHHYSILQGHMIHQKSILCWVAAQETFLLIIKIVVLLKIFVKTMIIFFILICMISIRLEKNTTEV